MASKPATIALCEHVDGDAVLAVASAMSGSVLYRVPQFLDDAQLLVDRGVGVSEADDEWDLLFEDHNERALRWGYFSHDENERRSRRLDMRGPTDFDPGPLAMCEPDVDDACVILVFRR